MVKLGNMHHNEKKVKDKTEFQINFLGKNSWFISKGKRQMKEAGYLFCLYLFQRTSGFHNFSWMTCSMLVQTSLKPYLKQISATQTFYRKTHINYFLLNHQNNRALNIFSTRMKVNQIVYSYLRAWDNSWRLVDCSLVYTT